MPGAGTSSSLDALPALAEEALATCVVILTMQENPEYARTALQAGAKAYVLKEAADGELVHAVRRAAAGEVYPHPRLGAQIATIPSEAAAPVDDLTDREARCCG